MIAKRIFPAAWFRDEPIAHLIDVCRSGIDKHAFQKYASEDFLFNVDVKPEKTHSYLHLISTGAGEVYGPNTNADYFNKTAREVRFPQPVDRKNPARMLSSGLEGYHQTFMKYGAVYVEHNNSRKKGKPCGEIIAQTVNPRMHRGELIIRVPNDVWADDLQKMASGKPLTFSMGCGVPADYCSICGNRAPTRKQYCSHMQYYKLQLDKEGNQVFAYNDEPHFHDISKVVVPADKIAFGLRKVASGAALEDVLVDAEHVSLPVNLIRELGTAYQVKKAEALEKLSAIEKRIIMQGHLSNPEEALAQCGCCDLPAEDISELIKFPLEDVLGALKQAGVLLAPRTFIRIVVKKPVGHVDGLDAMPRDLSSVFSDLAKEGTEQEAIESSVYDPVQPMHWTALDRTIQKIAAQHALHPEIIQRKVIHNSLQPLQKQASNTLRSSAESRYLAREYAKYQISFMAGTDPALATYAVLFNQSTRT